LKLEYLEDAEASLHPRVLLLYEATASELEALRASAAELAASDPGAELNLDALPGLVGIDGCSLVAAVGASDLGVEPRGDQPRRFRCVLSPPGWQRVHDLLEPFLAGQKGTSFQYLTEVGAIEWIFSTERGW
jgi:hypothetical protein